MNSKTNKAVEELGSVRKDLDAQTAKTYQMRAESGEKPHADSQMEGKHLLAENSSLEIINRDAKLHHKQRKENIVEQGEGPETISMLDSSEPATTGNEDDDKTLANMNIKRNFLALQTNQKTRISHSTGEPMISFPLQQITETHRKKSDAFRFLRRTLKLIKVRYNATVVFLRSDREPILGGAQLEKEPFIYDTLDIGHTELSHPRVTELSDDSENEEDEEVSAELLSNANTALRDNYMPGAFGDEDVCPHHGPFLSKDRAEPNGEYDHSNILETLLHEMLHAMYTLVKPGDWKPAYIWLRKQPFGNYLTSRNKPPFDRQRGVPELPVVQKRAVLPQQAIIRQQATIRQRILHTMNTREKKPDAHEEMHGSAEEPPDIALTSLYIRHKTEDFATLTYALISVMGKTFGS
ncbi:MAG: hypothetical protein Q9199_005837 [Rusavskia elegans]